jgi:large subunit ribosomal protein L22
MDVSAKTKYVRLSADKARDMARALRGLPADRALALARVSASKAGRQFYKTLRSAIANATQNHGLDAASLRVARAAVDEGPSLRRYWPRARGSASPIRRRMCHFTVVVTDGKD